MFRALLIAAAVTYASMFPKETREALSFFKENKAAIENGLSDLPANERKMAMAIVAPEVSQFSNFFDIMEMRTLYVIYLNTGVSDFSVGYFQIKPSFVETIEKYIEKSTSLKKRFGGLLPQGSDREKRKFRLHKLGSLSGQIQYLDAFMAIAKAKTAKMKFSSEEERLKYLATMYNSGINISPEKNATLQKTKYFPNRKRKFNYADVAWEFYKML